ncbi:GNAT family N-acetyltransferase [Arthrobacter sp. NPDC090010]|uniref:GNAT family N-acetyltransferase n=1 Tax=Arthrobacter sp. NPDC090010 TaxID=3363942 RepID=UPI0038150D3A
MDFTIRPRTARDLPALAELLERQQPVSRYPAVWPFPGGVESFLVRTTERGSWVAELADGTLAGHVSITLVDDDGLGRHWADALDAEIDDLRCVSALFTDPDLAGAGIGSALLDHATQRASADGGRPVLDVVAASERPVALYQRRGWRIIATVQAHWHPGLELPIHLMVLPGTGHRPTTA